MTNHKTVFVEGGGDSKLLKSCCREAVTKLLIKCGFSGRLPRIVACGPRNTAFESFQTKFDQRSGDYSALLIDSEDIVDDIEQTWNHLKKRDNWTRPDGATDNQVFLMTTCMETWVLADRPGLERYYGARLQKSALPSIVKLESKSREDMLTAIEQATKTCDNAYTKNGRSFQALSNVDPVELRQVLPAFARMVRILDEKL